MRLLVKKIVFPTIPVKGFAQVDPADATSSYRATSTCTDREIDRATRMAGIWALVKSEVIMNAALSHHARELSSMSNPVPAVGANNSRFPFDSFLNEIRCRTPKSARRGNLRHRLQSITGVILFRVMYRSPCIYRYIM